MAGCWIEESNASVFGGGSLCLEQLIRSPVSPYRRGAAPTVVYACVDYAYAVS